MASENAEWKERIEKLKPRIDDNVEDEETGLARARLRKEVEKKRQVEAEERKGKAAEFFSRVKAAKPLTDESWSLRDLEAADVARGRMAAESRTARSARREAIKKANREMKKMLSQVKALTDNDISDEIAGEFRAKKAAESTARRKARAEDLSRKNKEMQKRIANATSRTDDDVTDEAAGDARGNLAAESQARKASEAKRLAKENAQLSERIANTHAKTDDGDGLQF